MKLDFLDERYLLKENVCDLIDELDIASDRVGSAYLDNNFGGSLHCEFVGCVDVDFDDRKVFVKVVNDDCEEQWSICCCEDEEYRTYDDAGELKNDLDDLFVDFFNNIDEYVDEPEDWECEEDEDEEDDC